jgi:hypothetical protein
MAGTIGSISEQSRGVTHILSSLLYRIYIDFRGPGLVRSEEEPLTVKVGDTRVDSKTQVGSAHERHWRDSSAASGDKQNVHLMFSRVLHRPPVYGGLFFSL